MSYDRTATAITTQAVIQLFGRYNSDEPWQKLTNKSGNHNVEMTAAPATDVDPNDHAWDLDGCDQVLAGVNTAFNGTDGDDTLAKLQLKVI